MKELLRKALEKLGQLKDLAMDKLNWKQDSCGNCGCNMVEEVTVEETWHEPELVVEKPKRKRKNVRNKRQRF